MPELERTLETKLIEQLTQGVSQWTYCPELNTEEKLWDNLRQIIESNNRDKLRETPLSNQEFEQVKNQLSFSSFYNAAEWIVGENGKAYVHVQRGNETLHLLVLNRAHVTGGTSVYQVINQCQTFKDEENPTESRARRFDVTLLINGLPLIHIELKNRQHSYKEAFRQIVKYAKEGQFTGIFSTIQMFVVSNDVDTKYIAAARSDELNDKFLSGWVDAENKAVPGLFDFAKTVLRIPEAHEMITQYTVLDKEKERIILLRPYQIHAIEAIREASKRGVSGFVWHTTGSGKTLTSYKAARNLLQDIPSIEKTIFLIDRKDLDQQTTSAFQSYAENDVVDVDDTENVKELIKKLQDPTKEMIVTTRQKIQHMILRWLEKKPDSAVYKRIMNLRVAFVVDECHRAVSPETKRKMEQFFRQSLWYGFTGTPRFGENAYEKKGDLPRTTKELYGDILHAYTVKEAIHDGAVLGFQVEHLGPKGLEEDEYGNTIHEDMRVYTSKDHMYNVIDTMVNKSYEKLGFQNGGGKTYEGILTVGSIPIAQAYYDLFRQVKEGNGDVKIREDIRRVLPDFPKVAITYSLSENEEKSMVNQEAMQRSLDDYNAMFGTAYGLDQIGAYNANLNDRLARKQKKYQTRTEQLDFVIVVDRLLTGFDAPCLSTLYIDRQPMQLHNIIQAFSRTNRIFDAGKTYGQILTFQSPGTFKNKVDEALCLFSQGGEDVVLAPDWEGAEAHFIETLEELRVLVPDPAAIPAMTKKEKRVFAKVFQRFDSALKQLKAFTNFQDKNLERDYGLTDDENSAYKGHYVNVIEELRKDEPSDDGAGGEETGLDFEYTLQSYGGEIIDYEYIVALMQDFVSKDDVTSHPEKYEKQRDEITKYIQEIQHRNNKLGDIMMDLWINALRSPEEYREKQLITILEQTKRESIRKIVHDLCQTWGLDEQIVLLAAHRYEAGDEHNPYIEKSIESGDYNAFAAKHGTSLRKYQYRKAVRDALQQTFEADIVPLREGTVVIKDDDTDDISKEKSPKVIVYPESGPKKTLVAEKPSFHS